VNQQRYAATSAPLETAQVEPSKVRKPVVVWITQILGAVYIAVAAPGIYRTAQAFVLMLKANAIVSKFLFVIGFGLLVFTAIALMTIQLQRRSSLGRWLAILFVLQFLLILIFGASKIMPPFDSGLTRWSGSLVGLLLVFAVLVWWLYAIGFSRRARAWFTKTDHAPDPSAPR
jgi:uncharacterized membrane protein